MTTGQPAELEKEVRKAYEHCSRESLLLVIVDLSVALDEVATLRARVLAWPKHGT